MPDQIVVREPAQAVPEGPRRGGRGPLRRRRRGLRPARTERRRQDHDARDDRGPHAAGRRRDRDLRPQLAPERAGDPLPDRRAAAGDEPLQQDHAARGARPLRQLLPEAARRPTSCSSSSSSKDKADAYHVTLSGGQAQRLALALALVNDPEVVFLDEPTAGLDPQGRRSLWEVVRRMKAEGRTTMLTTHYMDEAEALCDRLAILDHGKILRSGTPAELIAGLGIPSVVELTFDGAAPDPAAFATRLGVRGRGARRRLGDPDAGPEDAAAAAPHGDRERAPRLQPGPRAPGDARGRLPAAHRPQPARLNARKRDAPAESVPPALAAVPHRVAALRARPRRHVLDVPLPAADALRLRRDLPLRRAAGPDARAGRAGARDAARPGVPQGARGIAPQGRDAAPPPRRRRAGRKGETTAQLESVGDGYRLRLNSYLIAQGQVAAQAASQAFLVAQARLDRLARAGAHPGRRREPGPRALRQLRRVPRAGPDRPQPAHHGALRRRHGDRVATARRASSAASR